MKNYQKPVCTIVRINIETTLLAGSMEGGEIGGKTDHFDTKKQNILWEEDDNL